MISKPPVPRQRAARTEGWVSVYLAVVRNSGVAVLQVREHDEPIVGPLRGNISTLKYTSDEEMERIETGTYEPRDEVEAPHGVETDLVYPHGQVEEHNPDRDVGDDDIVPCTEVSFPLGCSGASKEMPAYCLAA